MKIILVWKKLKNKKKSVIFYKHKQLTKNIHLQIMYLHASIHVNSLTLDAFANACDPTFFRKNNNNNNKNKNKKQKTKQNKKQKKQTKKKTHKFRNSWIFFNIIFEINMKNASEWVQTSICLVQWFWDTL